MKRSFLEELGLEKDVIDKIMDENGKDVEKAKGSLYLPLYRRGLGGGFSARRLPALQLWQHADLAQPPGPSAVPQL